MKESQSHTKLSTLLVEDARPGSGLLFILFAPGRKQVFHNHLLASPVVHVLPLADMHLGHQRVLVEELVAMVVVVVEVVR